MMAQTPTHPQNWHSFHFHKKAIYMYVYKNIFYWKTKVKHLCREQTTVRLLHSVQNEVLKFLSIAATWFQEFQFLKQTNKQTESLPIFYIFPKVSRHGNICLKVNKKFTNIAFSSDVLQDFWFLNGISALFTKTTLKDSNEQNSVNTVRQHSMDRRCFNWQMKNSKFLLY